MRRPAYTTRKSRNQTLYVCPEDEPAWEAAREMAQVHRMSLSEYVAVALRDKIVNELAGASG